MPFGYCYTISTGHADISKGFRAHTQGAFIIPQVLTVQCESIEHFGSLVPQEPRTEQEGKQRGRIFITLASFKDVHATPDDRRYGPTRIQLQKIIPITVPAAVC